MLSITGSRVRAAVLGELLGDEPHPRSIAELAKVAGVQRSAVFREVRRLVAAGLIEAAVPHRKQGPLYQAAAFPGHLDLRRFVVLSHGHAARVRAALVPLDAQQLAWIHGTYARSRPTARQIGVVSICGDPRAARDRLAALSDEIGFRIVVDAMRIAEWVTRLQKREMRVLALRRAQRLWVIGDDDLLRRRERDESDARAALKHAIANWREELSDEWDEDYDPLRRPY